MKALFKILLILACFFLLSECAITPRHIDEGGYIGQYVDFIERTQKTGEPVIIDYDCYSACIIKLSAGSGLRVSKEARFGVHEARDVMFGKSYFDKTSRRSDISTLYLRVYVPPCATKLFDSKRAFSRPEITFFSGEEVLHACPQIQEYQQ